MLAFIAFTCIAIGAILLSAGLLSEPGRRPGATWLLAVSIAGAIAYLLLGAALRRRHGPDGLYERMFLALELLWIVIAAVAARTRSTRPT